MNQRRERLEHLDRRIVGWMRRHGHYMERWALGLLFVWFGLLKVFQHKSATSIVAATVYVGDPETTTVVLGLWEAAIGVCLVIHPLTRVAIALLMIRLPGTLVALIVKSDVCWTDTSFVPTIQGQYLIKDAMLFAAAMVIGGGLRPWSHRLGAARVR